MDFRQISATTNALFVHLTWKAGSYAATYVFTLDSIEEHFDKGISILVCENLKEVNVRFY